MILIQILSAFFCIFMIYSVFVNFKKKTMKKLDYYIWFSIWGIVLFFSIFPNVLDSFFEVMGVIRALDFFVICAFLLVFAMLFYFFKALRKLEDRQKKVIKELALKPKK